KALADLRALEATRPSREVGEEVPFRFNLAYYSSQFYGPKPEYLESARSLLREAQATKTGVREIRRLVAKMAFAYGAAGANIHDLESVIAEARADGAELDAIYAQRDLAMLRRQSGKREGVEDALCKSLVELRRRGVKRGEPTLYREYGYFLVQDYRVAEG